MDPWVISGQNRESVLFPGKVPRERLGTNTRRIGTIQHFRWLGAIVWATLFLNVIDAVLTLVWINQGRATEANPLMEALVNEHPVLFVIVKFSLVFLGSMLLWRYRKRPLSVISIFGAFMVYYGVILYHLQFMDLRMFTRFFQ